MDETELDEALAALGDRIDLDGPTGAYLSLEVTYPAAGQRTKADVRFCEKLEDDFVALADRKTVGRGISSADEVSDGGTVFWRESAVLNAAAAAPLRRLADRAAELVRAAGFRKGHTFALRLLAPDAAGKMIERVRPITAAGTERWRTRTDRLKLRPAKKMRPAGYPERLAYLAVWAERCDGVGGNDIYGLFAHEPDLQAFLVGLPAADRDGLIELYKTIVRNGDHQWLHDWWHSVELDDPADWPAWPSRVAWLFALLDRLREGGLLAGTRGKVRRTELLFWGDC